MCMMRQNGERESCEVAKSLAALDGRVGSLETRMDKMDGCSRTVSIRYQCPSATSGTMSETALTSSRRRSLTKSKSGASPSAGGSTGLLNS